MILHSIIDPVGIPDSSAWYPNLQGLFGAGIYSTSIPLPHLPTQSTKSTPSPLPPTSRRWVLQAPTSPRPLCKTRPSTPRGPETLECHRMCWYAFHASCPLYRDQSQRSSRSPLCPAAGYPVWGHGRQFPFHGGTVNPGLHMLHRSCGALSEMPNSRALLKVGTRKWEMRNEMRNRNKEMSLAQQWFCQGSLTILLTIPLASLAVIY